MSQPTALTRLRRIIAVAETVRNLIQAALLTFFLFLVALVLAAWLGAGPPLAVVAGVIGLGAGVMLSRRIWFGPREPEPEPEPAPPEHHFPGVQDTFGRILARQRVLGFLLIAELLALCVLRFAFLEDYPTLFGVPRGRVLVWVLAVAAVTLVLGLANWRCPNCRRNLGASLGIRQCLHCGIVLRG